MEGKKVRQQQLLETIREVGKDGIEHKKLVAVASWDLGIKEKTVNSYLETMLTLGKIVWDSSSKRWKAKN